MGLQNLDHVAENVRPSAQELQHVLRMGLRNQIRKPRQLTREKKNIVRKALAATGRQEAIVDTEVSGQPFTVKITTLSGESTEWKAYPDEPVNELRSRIAAHLELTDSRIRLLNGSTTIRRHLTCKQNNIEEGTNLTLIIIPPLYEGSDLYQKIIEGQYCGLHIDKPNEAHDAFDQHIQHRTKLNDAFACMVRGRKKKN